ncbi:hypothetical protein JDV09_12715 [Mycobacterium sp. Y57]|uniref:hypothetical protein n=1 Tax=Mycolicibacterium xanthum TaxID=2796469 RepID=UPI001C84BDC8|nr:hypothetical protein [Mycolicibacterium xanthum]MBX7432962.1 hypothetical protein [Mycolicibacterium xanthum]
MIEVTRPKLNRFTYAAMLLGAMAVAGTPLAYPTIATAAPNNSGTWDIERYDECMKGGPIDSREDQYRHERFCCGQSGGVWDGADCVAPPASPQGSRQLAGNFHIPSDIATAPTVTKDPPQPIQVPSDYANAPMVSQAPG